MPLYEYQSVEDGEIIELLRTMTQADEPVDDPVGKGRNFRRIHSTFSAAAAAQGGRPPMQGGCCPCGKNQGGCGV
jgi:predicted nucleic acid-binding Zn ribbon protein